MTMDYCTSSIIEKTTKANESLQKFPVVSRLVVETTTNSDRQTRGKIKKKEKKKKMARIGYDEDRSESIITCRFRFSEHYHNEITTCCCFEKSRDTNTSKRKGGGGGRMNAV